MNLLADPANCFAMVHKKHYLFTNTKIWGCKIVFFEFPDLSLLLNMYVFLNEKSKTST